MTGLLITLAGASLLGGVLCGRRMSRTWLALTLAGATAGVVAAVGVLTGGVPAGWEWRSAFAIGGEFLHMRLDGVSALFVVLLMLVGGAGAVYSREYWSDEHEPASAGSGRMWWNALILAMGWVLLASNGLHFLLGWEIFTVAAFFLITLDNRRRAVRRAGWLYLAASHAGTVLLFAFFALLAHRTGSWDLGPMRETVGSDANLASLFWLVLVGFGVKAGLFPLHVWLPSAHANAPSHVSAMLSGVALKMGVYGIVRFSGWLPVPPSAGWVVIVLGALSAVLGIAFALAQSDLKRLLAYCSVENIGVILVGIGAALLADAQGGTAAAWGQLALAGALLHVWNHGIFKALLFFGAGSVVHATGTREMSRLGGLWRAMPWTTTLFALGAIAVSALPPLNGFVSEWLITLGLFDAVIARSPAAWAAMPAAILLGVAGALALAAFIKAGTVVFLGAARTRQAARAHECGLLMRAPMVGLAGVCVAIGCAPSLFGGVVAGVVTSWNPTWTDVAPAAPMFRLGMGNLVLVVLALGAVLLVWRRASRNGIRPALTWDCGYAVPSARMQYTSGSFGGIASGWFFWILQTRRRLRRPRGPLPARAVCVDRAPETVLDHVIGPVATGILHVSTAVRRLQHGRLQSYIFYIVAGIAVLTLIVLLGGKS